MININDKIFHLMFNIVIALGLRQFYTSPVHTGLHYIFYFDSENTTLEFSIS